jgi:hypothetical protein
MPALNIGKSSLSPIGGDYGTPPALVSNPPEHLYRSEVRARGELNPLARESPARARVTLLSTNMTI